MDEFTEILSLNTESNSSQCFDYGKCSPGPSLKYQPCENGSVHPDVRYSAESASWVLTASILVFFMEFLKVLQLGVKLEQATLLEHTIVVVFTVQKAGFMLMELAFARDPKEKRYVVVLKHQDAFASAFGFFLIGFDIISDYHPPGKAIRHFFDVTDPILWFFKFTFASNAATIVGGCLVTNRYKFRMPAAFVSAFVISGIIHPLVARMIWSDQHCEHSLSPYRFCNYNMSDPKAGCGHNSTYCTQSHDDEDLMQRMYVLDFAGGGAVHLIGGMAGLVLCMFAKLQKWRDKCRNERRLLANPLVHGVEESEPEYKPKGFWTWMYPVHGGDEAVSEGAQGVLILWFSWFAFNCGSTESIEIGHKLKYGPYPSGDPVYPHYWISSIIAVNMIMAGASGGITAVVIAAWAQIRYRTESVNANEIANGVLSALVAITAGCPFVYYWGACLTGSIGVLLYHLGCYIEYKTGIEDTARVVPVHGVCGLWSLLATGLFMTNECNLHAAFEGLCFCVLRLPRLSYGERLLSQLVGGLYMIGVGGGLAFLTYFTLYIIPIGPLTGCLNRVFCLTPKSIDGRTPTKLKFAGGWLLTSPEDEILQPTEPMPDIVIDPDPPSTGARSAVTHLPNPQVRIKGTVPSYGSVVSTPTHAVPPVTPQSHSSVPSLRLSERARQVPAKLIPKHSVENENEDL